MNNKSLFISITLAFALMFGFFLHNQQITQLEQKIDTITSEYNAEIETTQFSTQTNDRVVDNSNPNILTLDELNNQLIIARSALQVAQQKSSLASSKSTVLTDEISQIKDSRGQVKSLKTSLEKSQQKLQVADNNLKDSNQKLQVSDKKLQVSDKKLQVSSQELGYLQRVFESQNKNIASNNIARITELQKSAVGIGIGGLLIPVVGAAMLVNYTVQEVNNYCANIKNIIDLEEKVFKKVVSLDTKMQQAYHQKCVVGFLQSQP